MYRMTALHHAVLTGNTELVGVLLENGSEVDVVDKRGENSGQCFITAACSYESSFTEDFSNIRLADSDPWRTMADYVEPQTVEATCIINVYFLIGMPSIVHHLASLQFPCSIE